MIKEADLNGDGLVDYAGIYNVSLNQYSSYISNEQISIRCSLSKSYTDIIIRKNYNSN